jgi:hypothetical protein
MEGQCLDCADMADEDEFFYGEEYVDRCDRNSYGK